MMKPAHLKASAAAFIALLLFFFFAGNPSTSTSNFATSAIASLRGVVPNQVHYVYLLRDPDSDFHFQFKHFISIYATALYLRPEVIYIHTDASRDSIRRAKDGNDEFSNKWTRLIFNMPKAKINSVYAPEEASVSKVKINGLEHKSDFVRVRVIHEFGGLYLDWDAIPLRDTKALRESGFNNVVGRQGNGEVQSGSFMAKKGSLLMKLWMRDQHVVYDGGWTTHSNELVTRWAPRLVRVPKEVLIMDQVAFTPGSWTPEGNREMYDLHFETLAALRDVEVEPENDTTGRWQSPEAFQPWEVDYSSTYILHAFNPDRNGENVVTNFSGITPQYVLARQSNFARAVYPAVRHALDARFFTVSDY